MKVLLLLLAGCGRLGFGEHLADAPGDTGSAGTRLKQEWDVYDMAARLPFAIYDSVLASECYPYDTPQGWRCLLPRDSLYFVDATCTQPVATRSSTSVYAFDTDNGEMAFHAYTYGPSIGMPATVYVRTYSGACLATTPSSELFQLTETTFDPFALLVPTYGSEGRLVTSTLAADDGFRTQPVLHDTLVNADCYGETFDDASVCFVAPTDVAYDYLDSGCTQVADEAFTQVQFSEHILNLPACKTTDFEVRPLGAELPRTTPLWQKLIGTTSCNQITLPSTRRLFSLGSAVPLATITRQPVGTGRIQLFDTAANGAHANDPFAVWDSQLGVECKPVVAADGMQRCLPNTVYAARGGAWTDAACTQPIIGAATNGPPCASRPVTYVLDQEGTTAGPHVFQASLYSGAIYSGGPGNCFLRQMTAFYVEGAEVPLDNFTVVTQQTDP